MQRLYCDENFPFPVVEELRSLGFDVMTMYEDGNANQSVADEEVLSIATRLNRALITMNRKHFIRLHRNRPDHAGIVVCKFDHDFPGQARRIADVLRKESSVMARLFRVYRPG